MRILYISNNSDYNYVKCPRGSVAMPYLFHKRGHEVLALGKEQLLHFYSFYRAFKPEVIVATWIPSGFLPVVFKKLGLIKCPIVHAWDDYYAEQMTKYPKLITRFMENFTIKNSDFITTVSRYNEHLARKMHKRVLYLPHGVEGNTIKTKYNLSKLKTGKKNLIAIYLGEQSRYKQVDRIIKAVKDKPCDLFLFGAINRELLPLKTKNVHFMGYANPKEVPSLLKQADILVNTSDQDSNFKFFEYIRAGKPILAYAGRPRFLFEHGKTAYLTKDFSSGLKELISNAKLRRVLEENVKKMKTYSWEEIADKYLEFLSKVVRPWKS